jgi:cytochrome b6-f complex iron-sulfur subunit
MAPVIALVVILLVLAAIAVVFVGLRRRDTQTAVGYLSRETVTRDRSARGRAEPAPVVTGREVERAAVEARQPGKELVPLAASPPVAWRPPEPDQLGVARRQFLNRGIIVGMLLSISGFGAACLAFLWPEVSGGAFGSKIRVGKVSDIKGAIDDADGFFYFPEGRMWITEYPAAALPKAKKVYSESELAGMENGLIALYQKCVHLGCRVPACLTSQWFECPCHGSQYNRVGEKKGGPAPRGLDRFGMAVTAGNFIVDTGLVITGPPIGTNTTGQEAEGPHCISGAGGAHK